MKKMLLVGVLALAMVCSVGVRAFAEHHYRHPGRGWAVAGGVLAGLIVLDALLGPRETVVYQAPPVVYQPPAVYAPPAGYVPPVEYVAPAMYVAPPVVYPPTVVYVAPPPYYYGSVIYRPRPWYGPVYRPWGYSRPGGYWHGGYPRGPYR